MGGEGLLLAATGLDVRLKLAFNDSTACSCSCATAFKRDISDFKTITEDLNYSTEGVIGILKGAHSFKEKKKNGES